MAREPVALPLHGGCLCGAVRYRLNGAPLLVYACHCHRCQTRSGSAFTLSVVIRSEDLTLEGDVETVRRTARRSLAGDSPRPVDDSACRLCRTPLVACALAAPDYATLRAGTLDDAAWAVPIAQAYVESAIPWAIIPGVRQVEAADFDYEALGQAWRATAPAFV